jgi:hypothetical protein
VIQSRSPDVSRQRLAGLGRLRGRVDRHLNLTVVRYTGEAYHLLVIGASDL